MCSIRMGIVTLSDMAAKYLQDDGVVDSIVLRFLLKCIQMAFKGKRKAPQHPLIGQAAGLND